MKKIILTLALIGLSAVASQAQSVVYAGGLTGGTNNVAATSTNTYYATVLSTNVSSTYSNGVTTYTTNVVSSVQNAAGFTVPGSRFVTIQPEYSMLNGGNAGTSNAVFRIDNSVDAVVWNNGVTNLAVTASNGTNVNTATFVVDTGGANYWRCGAVYNTNGAVLTNISVPIGKKNGL